MYGCLLFLYRLDLTLFSYIPVGNVILFYFLYCIFISAIIVNGGSHAERERLRAPGKLGRVFDLNCCSSELHKQPGERDNPVPAKAVKLDQAHIAVGGREHISLSVGKADAHQSREGAIGRRKIRASRWNYIGRCASNNFVGDSTSHSTDPSSKSLQPCRSRLRLILRLLPSLHFSYLCAGLVRLACLKRVSPSPASAD